MSGEFPTEIAKQWSFDKKYDNCGESVKKMLVSILNFVLVFAGMVLCEKLKGTVSSCTN